ncbi:MAG: mannose-1-phosphate guanylyltransferase/mannose-6-phosphate isomerase [Alphaproteobacteria bacterium]
MYPVILSGGSGTRLWPLSRPLYPKQFLPLHSEQTLFQETLGRLQSLEACAPIIMCNEEHRFIVAENIRALGAREHSILLEPVGRNTAPAIAVSALQALKEDEQAILLVLPADHVITDKVAFAKSVKTAETMAQQGLLVTFGIKPVQPHTGYGYIEAGKELAKGAFELSGFKEKPDTKTAQAFIEKGNYLWNSGMFCFKARTYLEELEKNNPDIVLCARAALQSAQTDLDFIRLNAEHFEKCEDISIDYALMEKTRNGVVVSLDAGWSDIGSWDALWDVCEKNKDNNVLKGDVLTKQTQNCLVHADNKLVCTLGLDDIIVVDTKDALLVAHKEYVQKTKDIVGDLKKAERTEALHHRTVYRPWGHYDSICFGQRDQVKRITVKPGAKLSLQKHFHRSEHWVVVKGTAAVTRGEDVIMLSENESVYLPVGTVHALENPGKIPLELIEVQTGSYLGEDDIVRFEDLYGRT